MAGAEKAGKIIGRVLARVTPRASEIRGEKRVSEIAVRKILAVRGKHTRAVLAGSLARNTHLRGDKDIDIFVVFPAGMKREEFVREGLRVAKKAFSKTKWRLDYGEHPYLKTVFMGHELEVIPSYDVQSASERKSAVDRSPFHNAYVLSRLGKGQEGEVRLLKKFMKGIDCYGAELKTQGFSGYLCELLVLRHGTFMRALGAAGKWRNGTAIDIEGQWKSGAELRKRFPRDALIVVDPTDRNRNVAAAVNREKFEEFRLAAREFIARPSMEFFFPRKVKAVGKRELEKLLGGKNLLLVAFPYARAHEDVVYGQLKKASGQLRKRLELHEFEPKRSAVFSDEEKECAILIELKKLELPETRLHPGPPAEMKDHAKAFIEKHGAGAKPVVIGGRLHVLVKRKHIHAKSVALEFCEGLKREGKSWLEKRAKKKFRVFEGKEIAGACAQRRLAEFVLGFARK